tara:strand:- start:859 stop:1425 length:567 start_codon:yes stop_codon:yes gene_type:complete
MIRHLAGATCFGSLIGSTLPGTANAAAESINLPNGMRCIITGHDGEGQSYIVSDERVTSSSAFPNVFKTTGDDPFGPGPESSPRTLYSTDSPYLEPTAGGANFHFVTLQPTKNDASAVWHRTETVDMNVLLGGELILMLDKGETTLQPGDVVIQRNTNHAWKNPSDTPAYWIAVLVPISQEVRETDSL